MDAKKELNEYRFLIKNSKDRYKREILSLCYGTLMVMPVIFLVFSCLFLFNENFKIEDSGIKIALSLMIISIFYISRKRIERFIMRDRLSRKIQFINQEKLYKGSLSDIFDMECPLTIHVLKTRKRRLEIEISKNDGIHFCEILKIIDEIEYLKEILLNDNKIRAIQDFCDIQDKKAIKSELITNKTERENLIINVFRNTENKTLSTYNFYLMLFGISLSFVSMGASLYLTTLLYSEILFKDFIIFSCYLFLILSIIGVFLFYMHINKEIYSSKNKLSKSLYDLFDMKDEIALDTLLRASDNHQLLNHYLLDGKYEKSRIEILRKDIKSKNDSKKDLDLLNEKIKNKTGMIAELENLK